MSISHTLCEYNSANMLKVQMLSVYDASAFYSRSFWK
jgi:hypothetical protein